MKLLRTALPALFALVTAAPAALAAGAADYPSRPIEMVVPSTAGGGTDVMARLFAETAKKYIAQPIVVSNKPGASGGIAMAEVQRAAPDGYKVGVLISELAIIPHLNMAKVTTADFIPIARLNGDPGLIAVKADSPLQTIDDLLAQARKQPGSLTMGNAGTGTIWHLAAAAVEEKTGVKFNHVPYQGAAPSVMALVGGHVDAITVSPAEIGSFVAAGKVRVLVSMADHRLSAPYDKVPTFKEKGTDLVLGTWRGLGVPLGTPPEVVQVLREAARKTAEDPAFRDALTRANLQPAYMDGVQFQTFMNSQSDYFKKLLGGLHIQK
ncbi:tripartite tricarboxylate transporter substrate binding protein [Variovorax paradoxus]|jgi:tripartite-type tricarboxylate transporter receptor subunit TctC|uniref:tripartite tricarboxylate transporter substrate binding protein n=1 Tax=Variovorax paradoxus TaxID=34073 RepID=UPI0029C8B93F|nr:tripartite tricarboxylate transporter substrate binding protein [Variovorax paradoxus]WPH23255.1 tripartite tricarboxylate transporter substrate binding protein [Variovorax paradoxus]